MCVHTSQQTASPAPLRPVTQLIAPSPPRTVILVGPSVRDPRSTRGHFALVISSLVMSSLCREVSERVFSAPEPST